MKDQNIKALLIIGNDKIGRKLINQIEEKDDFVIALYNTRDYKRLFKLILINQTLSINAALHMIVAELLRKNSIVENLDFVTSNDDIQQLIKSKNIKKVVLFRAGIIINNNLLSSDVDFFNIHCAKIPEFGGIGQIFRIYKEKAFRQVATLHKVEKEIDRGEVIATKDYLLDESLTYLECENIAYNTGIELFLNYINHL